MMNERIRQLADQARFVDTLEYPHQDEVFEKFAELIVRECMDATRGSITGLDAFNNIKNHFGIEQ